MADFAFHHARVASLDNFRAGKAGLGVEVPFVVREDFGSGCFVRECAGNLIEFVEEDTP